MSTNLSSLDTLTADDRAFVAHALEILADLDEGEDNIDGERLRVLAATIRPKPRQRLMTAVFDITGLTEREAANLEMYVAVQAEGEHKSDDDSNYPSVPVATTTVGAPFPFSEDDTRDGASASLEAPDFDTMGEDDLRDLAKRLYAAEVTQATTPASVEPPYEVGTIVALRHDIERYPHFVAPKGARGLVTDIGDPNIFAVSMTKRIAGAEDWDNEVHWILDAGDDPRRDLVSVCGYCDGLTASTDRCESCGIDHRDPPQRRPESEGFTDALADGIARCVRDIFDPANDDGETELLGITIEPRPDGSWAILSGTVDLDSDGHERTFEITVGRDGTCHGAIELN